MRLSTGAALLCALALAFALVAPAAADRLQSDFEEFSTGFGTLHGQSGWRQLPRQENEDPFDVEVVRPSLALFDRLGRRALRVSNAVTTTAFGVLPFTPPLANAAGQADSHDTGLPAGTRQTHFAFEFDFTSAAPEEHQEGLRIAFSPSHSETERVAYLAVKDTADGLALEFQDFRDGAFKPTDVATALARSQVYRARLEIDFVDGPANDVVRVFLDGKLVHTGTTWEAYYQGAPPRVRFVMIETRQAAQPHNANKGLLLDNMDLSSWGRSACDGVTAATLRTLRDVSSESFASFESYDPAQPLVGQHGWTSHRPQDALNTAWDYSIVSSDDVSLPDSFGKQALRISNAVSDTNFNKQLHMPALQHAAGEPNAWTGNYNGRVHQPHYAFDFDFTSAAPDVFQEGLRVGFAAGLGDEVRMVEVVVRDTAEGLQLEAWEPNAAGNLFESAVLGAALARDQVHHVRVEVDFAEGLSNDVVRVYLNGALVHTGRTWETYYEYLSSWTRGPGVVRAVMLEMRTGAGTNAANIAGRGLLIDNMHQSSWGNAVCALQESSPVPLPPLGLHTLTTPGVATSVDAFAIAPHAEDDGKYAGVYLSGVSATAKTISYYTALGGDLSDWKTWGGTSTSLHALALHANFLYATSDDGTKPVRRFRLDTGAETSVRTMAQLEGAGLPAGSTLQGMAFAGSALWVVARHATANNGRLIRLTGSSFGTIRVCNIFVDGVQTQVTSVTYDADSDTLYLTDKNRVLSLSVSQRSFANSVLEPELHASVVEEMSHYQGSIHASVEPAAVAFLKFPTYKQAFVVHKLGTASKLLSLRMGEEKQLQLYASFDKHVVKHIVAHNGYMAVSTAATAANTPRAQLMMLSAEDLLGGGNGVNNIIGGAILAPSTPQHPISFVSDSSFQTPQSLARDSDGNVYVAEGVRGGRILRIDAATGTQSEWFSLANDLPADSGLNGPNLIIAAIAWSEQAGCLYGITSAASGVIFSVKPGASSQAANTVAAVQIISSHRPNQPRQIAISADGGVYIPAGSGKNFVIYAGVSPDLATANTAQWQRLFSFDSTVTSAPSPAFFSSPGAMTWGSNGEAFVSDLNGIHTAKAAFTAAPQDYKLLKHDCVNNAYASSLAVLRFDQVVMGACRNSPFMIDPTNDKFEVIAVPHITENIVDVLHVGEERFFVLAAKTNHIHLFSKQVKQIDIQPAQLRLMPGEVREVTLAPPTHLLGDLMQVHIECERGDARLPDGSTNKLVFSSQNTAPKSFLYFAPPTAGPDTCRFVLDCGEWADWSFAPFEIFVGAEQQLVFTPSQPILKAGEEISITVEAELGITGNLYVDACCTSGSITAVDRIISRNQVRAARFTYVAPPTPRVATCSFKLSGEEAFRFAAPKPMEILVEPERLASFATPEVDGFSQLASGGRGWIQLYEEGAVAGSVSRELFIEPSVPITGSGCLAVSLVCSRSEQPLATATWSTDFHPLQSASTARKLVYRAPLTAGLDQCRLQLAGDYQFMESFATPIPSIYVQVKEPTTIKQKWALQKRKIAAQSEQ